MTVWGQDTIDDPIYKIPVLGKNEDPAALITKNIFVQVEKSSPSIFTGQPVLVTYKLFTALNSQSRVTQQPAFSGCSVYDLPIDKEPDEETFKGKRYHVFIIRKVQLIPFAPGELILGAASVNNIVAISHSGNLLETENYSAVTSNTPQSIQVKSLPVQSPGSDILEMVGSFSIRAELSADTIPVGESATLKIRISGAGNIRGIPMPVVSWPATTEHFDATDTQHTDEYVFPIEGYKQFDIPFIGKTIGATFIPPIHLSYFDPATATYQNIHTDTLRLYFTAAVTKSNLQTVQDTGWNGFAKFTWLIPVFLLVTGFVIYLSRKKKSKKEPSKKTDENVPASPTPKAATPDTIFIRLHQLDGIEDDKNYFREARKILMQALQQKTGLDSVTESVLVDALKEMPAYTTQCPTCTRIFETCNRQLFALEESKEKRVEVSMELVTLLRKLYPEPLSP